MSIPLGPLRQQPEENWKTYIDLLDVSYVCGTLNQCRNYIVTSTVLNISNIRNIDSYSLFLYQLEIITSSRSF